MQKKPKVQDSRFKVQALTHEVPDNTQASQVLTPGPYFLVPFFKKPSRRNGTALLIVPFKKKSL